MSIIDKEKFNGSNFLDCYLNLRIVLRNEQKLHHLKEALPEAPPATTTAAVRKAYTRRVSEQQEVACLMLEEGQSVSTYVLKMKAYLDQIERLVYSMPLVLGGLRGIQKMNKCALDLYAGIGNCAAVKAIGSFDITLPNGMDNRFLYKFTDNGAILFSMDDLFYFNAIPHDGIFEIDMHNHISNESSIYTCSNNKSKHNIDYTFLWYCRLGHINKKRIMKLQHDGLFESTDDESFDIYVSCISGMMARKPFTHVSERADDLLRLIHSDVCGPFRTTSREGANYYVSFTDDFSRFGYVYLIKHKHEVFEMFKTF
nr:hypothetical protein [Tanacetum cinerariifolium]